MKRQLLVEWLEGRILLTTGPIDTLDRNAVAAAYASQYKPFIDVPVGWTGSVQGCVAGTVSPTATTATLNVLNFLRNLAGLQGVELDEVFNDRAQKAALMMHAQNSLSHSPGTNWACYSQAGAQGAGASNLYLGVTGSRAMVGYVEDPGDGNYPVGHRRWLLNPNVAKMGIGSTSNANALYVFGPYVNRPAPEWISWPPQGYVPKDLVFPRWSLSRAGANFNEASVTMILHGETVPVNVRPVVNGYGLNTVVWEPQLPLDLVSGEEYTIDVVVENVLIGGARTSFQYTVTPIQPGPPVQTVAAAQDDRFSMAAGSPHFYFDVLANDDLTHVDWAPASTSSLTANIVGNPKHGYLLRAIGSPGILFYFPNQGFTGVDTFSYRVAALDVGRVSNLAHVQITVGVATSPANQPPSISSIANITATSGLATEPISFEINDLETPAASLVVTATSANRSLIPNQNITLAGNGRNRTVTITPAAAKTGSDTITIWVSDGVNNSFESFVVTVRSSGVVKVDPVVTWDNPVAITFGTALSVIQLNAAADVPGRFTYNPPLGTILDVGMEQILSATFEPTDSERYRSVTKTVTIDVLAVWSVWQNHDEPLDVNADNRISALDALLVINYLNSMQSRFLPDSGYVSPPYVDVNGDQRVSALDALLVINRLNSRSTGNQGEGEFSPGQLEFPRYQGLGLGKLARSQHAVFMNQRQLPMASLDAWFSPKAWEEREAEEELLDLLGSDRTICR